MIAALLEAASVCSMLECRTVVGVRICVYHVWLVSCSVHSV